MPDPKTITEVERLREKFALILAAPESKSGGFDDFGASYDAALEYCQDIATQALEAKQ